jgi:hypothetical protein
MEGNGYGLSDGTFWAFILRDLKKMKYEEPQLW